MLRNLLRPLGLQDFAVLIGLFSLIAVQMTEFANDPGVGWHLKSGEVLLSQSLPFPSGTDPFLAAPAVRNWVSDQWLSDIFLHLAWRIGSWPLLYALLTTIYGITFFVLLYQAVYRRTASALLSSIAVLLSFKIAQIHFILRPVLLSFFFFTLIFRWTLELLGECKDSRARVICFGSIPFAFLVWANVHPSFVLGLMLLVLFVFCQIVQRRAGLARYSGALVLAAIVTLINPAGWELHRSIFLLGHSDLFMKMHMEWQPIDLGSYEGALFCFALALIGISWLVTARNPRKDKPHPYEFLAFIVFTVLTFKAVRFVPYWGIVMALPFVRAITSLGAIELCSRSGLFSWLFERLGNLEAREKHTAHGYTILAAALFVVVISAQTVQRIPFFDGTFGPERNKFPYGATEELRKAAPNAAPVVALAPPEWGGFITLHGWPQVRAVIDDRNTMLGEEFYREYFDAMKPEGAWAEFASKLHADYLLVPVKSAMGKSLKSRLPVQYEDGVAVLLKLHTVR